MQDAASADAQTRATLSTGDRLLAVSDVCRTTGRGKTWIMEASRGGSFPSPAKISGRLFWSDHEVQQWIAERLSERS